MRNEYGQFIKGHPNIGGMKGKQQTNEARGKIRKSLLGIFGEGSRRWKGDDASYSAKHIWFLKRFGKATHCENKRCTFKNPKRYEWANISKKHLRDRNDYIMLCCSCHRKFDYGIIQLTF